MSLSSFSISMHYVFLRIDCNINRWYYLQGQLTTFGWTFEEEEPTKVVSTLTRLVMSGTGSTTLLKCSLLSTISSCSSKYDLMDLARLLSLFILCYLLSLLRQQLALKSCYMFSFLFLINYVTFLVY
jgi:hypothetical protein